MELPVHTFLHAGGGVTRATARWELSPSRSSTLHASLRAAPRVLNAGGRAGAARCARVPVGPRVGRSPQPAERVRPAPFPSPGAQTATAPPYTRATARDGRWRFGLQKCFHCGPSSQPFTSLKEAVAQNAGWRALERTLEVSGVSSERSLTPINYIFPRESFAQMPTLCRPPNQNEARNSDRPEA